MRSRDYSPFIRGVEQLMPFVWATLALILLTTALMLLVPHRPPPAQRALNPEYICVESLEGTNCIVRVRS
jgi:hypothetical protein